MLATTIWIFFIAQSFAKDLASHSHQQALNENVDSETPMDYFDTINLPNPHYKINYIYEQKRTDKAPEMEQVEEEIGKYLHYQPSTSTTTTEPQQNIGDVHENIDDIHENIEDVHENIDDVHENIDDVHENFKETNDGPFETPIIAPETHDHKYEKEKVTSTLAPKPPARKLRKPILPHFLTALPATVLSPPITQWEELDGVPNNAGFHLDQLHFSAHVPHRHPKHRLHLSPTTSEAPVEEEAHTNRVSTEKHIHLSPTTQVPSFKTRNDHHALANVRPILDDKQGSIGRPSRPVYRGSYKFSRDDIYDMHTSTEPKVSQLKENPIPSVPTLSPWYDGYGK